MSSTGCARNGPLIPPTTNSETNPIANSMGDEKRILPRHIVPSQLNVLMADGTPMPIVMMENANAVYGLIPLMNMWWPHTMNPRKPIARMAYTIALYLYMGVSETTESNWEQSPMAGRIAMYTSGCPKNQNKCCHKSGEPPLCPVRTPLTVTSGTKKLVPRLRSISSRIPAESRTPNASSPRIAVTNHAQHVSGMRIKVMPFARMSRVVVMKFSAPINAPMQKIAILIIQRSAPRPSPGPADGSALSGAYPVQPCSGAPPVTKKAATRTMNPRNVVQNESMFRTGNAMSDAPI